ncbi:hypothetical protein A2662_00515 [Candidatus Giovannonibacteria bacterium RIFCSPHIGHO2_01_FULL_45_33]|uniref:General secretion pathway GspH domain-containing protein n=1 Tax=Candidatus Giovannonibacteria bacterium RIFCSPLOWO2_01_FULL_45_34 TaxID=1798351 RepID=A0A1F5WYP2_9BACT|nr:MAG: hypothetical protein A2662_00515 [Candidatus Giovannonibacteria bacterium RIFCSPHIGHO2_01_FULL_45_33]OGF69793.1 MAG: hypothetical protein A3C73_03380 [Candidatus Giovannonibacteria bacterium RIFCSPHIGHO2_02_FULL_44_11]OGF80764.1 MAG: hypothetical protein A2930_02450 [Candidatus Giovannonibacteria bacterium RIFCSPLOWO2_01_FULL_45_34]
MCALNKQKKGFALVELIVVMGIMLMVSGLTIANFPAFRSQIAVSIALHELQLSLRQAQAYAIAVREFSPAFTAPICQPLVSPPARFPPYGVSITKNTSTYVLFADIACAVKTIPPYNKQIYNTGSVYGSEMVATKVMQGGAKVLSIDGCNGMSCIALDIVEVVYQRPSPSIIILGHSSVWASYTWVDITISSQNGAFTKVMRVRTSGQVSIQ